MTALAAPFKTTKEAAYQLGREAERSGHSGLIHLPFNRFDQVDDTTWWLCPGPDNPAYKYGKIVCTWKNFEPDMFIGLYVEKGLDPSKAGAGLSAKEKRYRMDSTWRWHDFLEGLRSGPIGHVTNLVEKQCQRPVVVALDGGVGQEDWDFVRFDYTAGALSHHPSSQGKGTLASSTTARSLPEIAELLPSIPNVGWVWIDFHIGQVFSPDGDEEWDVD